MVKNIGNYDISLDIGTNSVGYSVTQDYKLLKYHGKNMWGAHLFDKGETAAKRRLSRNTSRRIKRRKERISLLKQLIGGVVLKEDPNFFMRMEKGFQTKEDKGYDYNLFIGDAYNDKTYYEQFKTIYHLRKYLYTTKEKADPRLIYLALHHIIKYRGNFLYDRQKFELSDTAQVCKDLHEALEILLKQHDLDIDIKDEFIADVIKILINCDVKRGERKDTIIEYFVSFDSDSKKIATEIAGIILGYDCNLTKLFPLSGIKKDDKDYKTNFGSTKYEENLGFIEDNLKEDFDILQNLHKVYSYITLQNILNGHQRISDAMIKKYDDHKEDLKELKAFVKEFYPLSTYHNIFRNKDAKINNYHNYINEPKANTRELLYTFIKKELASNTNAVGNDTYKNIINKMEYDAYLLRQNSKDNGQIPYQLHEVELVDIIDNQGKYYPELLEVKDKLVQLFEFRIPYYVGPTNKNSSFAWIERYNNEKLTPWNFKDNVDLITSAEKFIRKMTNCCSYLLQEPVVAKNSLLYSKYEVLNELNKIRINKKSLTIELKHELYSNLFLQKKKVKKKDVIDYLVSKQFYNTDEIEVEDMQKEDEFATSLEPWIFFNSLYQDKFDESYDEIEKIIEWMSVYEDKKILKSRIEKEFPMLGKPILKAILSKKYKGWGRLSKKLLCDLKAKDKNGNFVSIMDILEQTNMNFMQIIHDKTLAFDDQIRIYNIKDYNNDEITYEQIKELPGSPAIKKGIWQSVKIVEEIVSIMKKQPQNIFIEFARDDEEKKRSVPRVKKLQDIYTKMKKDLDSDAAEAYAYLSKENKAASLSNDRLYLYYIQQGKCMYSGKALNIDSLQSYQIDHIIPQSYIKDDSIENKVLVYADYNQYKGDQLLLSKNIIDKRYVWWKKLLDNGLIGSKKFYNLTKSEMLEKEEMGFINRQLVETRQIIKHVANIFKNYYYDSNIVSIKANLSSNFREKYDLYKIRELNDYHHAQDAYLAAVIGTFVIKKYPILKKEFIFTQYNHINQLKNDLNKMNKGRNRYGFIINQMSNDKISHPDTGELLWEGASALTNIFKVFDYKDCFITKKLEEGSGQLYNLTLNKVKDTSAIKDNPHKVIPVNASRSDITKYGGFTNLNYAYGIAIRYKNENKDVKTIINVPIHLAKSNSNTLMDYIKAEVKSNNVEILKDKILINQAFEYESGLYTMASAKEWHNARQLILSKDAKKTLYSVLNKQSTDMCDEDILALYNELIYKLTEYYPSFKKIAKLLKENTDEFMKASDKVSILRNILTMTKANKKHNSLTIGNVKISASAGRIYNKTFDLDKTTFTSYSITGLRSNRYKL